MPQEFDEDLRTITLVTQILCMTIVSLFVGLRLFVAVKWKRHVDIEDYFCFLSWILLLAYCACVILYRAYGESQLPSMPTENQNTRLYKLYYVLTVIYPPLVLCVKTTLLSILARIFTLYQTQVVGVYSIFAIFVIYYTIIFFIKVFICSPISCFWTEFNNNIHCLNKGAVIIADAVMSVTSDMVILLLPLALTMPLNLPRPKKLKAALMLGCGGLAIGFSIYRLILVIHEKESISSPSVFMRVLLSGNAEIGFGLICSCVPAVHIFLTRSTQKYSSRRSDVLPRRGWKQMTLKTSVCGHQNTGLQVELNRLARLASPNAELGDSADKEHLDSRGVPKMSFPRQIKHSEQCDRVISDV